MGESFLCCVLVDEKQELFPAYFITHASGLSQSLNTLVQAKAFTFVMGQALFGGWLMAV